jgi:hypothetical protein
MTRHLKIILTQQTTPDELLVFIVLAALVALLLAFAFYASVLGLLWRGRLREFTTFRALLLPDRDQLRRHAGEYGLAIATALLLTLSVTARADVVAQIHATPLQDIRAEVVNRSLPLGAMIREGDPRVEPPELIVPEHVASMPASTLLLPLLASGQKDRAEFVARSLAGPILERSWARFITDRVLAGAAVLLLMGYATWLALSMSRVVSEAKRARLTDYQGLWRRLLVPALCLALLLTAAVGANDVQRAAQGAVASVEARVAEEDPLRTQAAALGGMILWQEEQVQRAGRTFTHVPPGVVDLWSFVAALSDRVEEAQSERSLLTSDLQGLNTLVTGFPPQITAVREEAAVALEEARNEWSGLEEGLIAAQQQWTQAGLRLDALGQELAQARADLDGLEDLTGVAAEVAQIRSAVASLRQALGEVAAGRDDAILVVGLRDAGGTYTVRRDGPAVVLNPAVVRGEWLGAHRLPPGSYVIQPNQGPGLSVTLGAGEVVTQVIPPPDTVFIGPS